MNVSWIAGTKQCCVQGQGLKSCSQDSVESPADDSEGIELKEIYSRNAVLSRHRVMVLRHILTT